MPFVLIAVPGSVTCGHGPGGVVAATGSVRLLVESVTMPGTSAGVLVAAGVAPKSIVPGGCSTPTSQGNVPCSATVAVTGGAATKLVVDGAPVLLSTLKGTTNGHVGGTTPQRLLTGMAKQARLEAT